MTSGEELLESWSVRTCYRNKCLLIGVSLHLNLIDHLVFLSYIYLILVETFLTID